MHGRRASTARVHGGLRRFAIETTTTFAGASMVIAPLMLALMGYLTAHGGALPETWLDAAGQHGRVMEGWALVRFAAVAEILGAMGLTVVSLLADSAGRPIAHAGAWCTTGALLAAAAGALLMNPPVL